MYFFSDDLLSAVN